MTANPLFIQPPARTATLRRILATLLMAAAPGAALAADALTTPPADDPAPGTRLVVDPTALPAPGDAPSPANSPDRISRPEGAAPRLPDGFRATLFAGDLSHPRQLLVAPNGDVLLAESRAGQITLLRDTDDDGRADIRETLVDGLSTPYGLGLREGALWVADTRGVWRYAYQPGDRRITAEPEAMTPPDALGSASGHSTRGLALDPETEGFWVSIGSRGNIGIEPEPRATIQRFDRPGAAGTSFATGLRNPVGLAIHPETGALWTVVNERDGLGDALVPDYLARVTEGGFYGWPYGWAGADGRAIVQPGYEDRAQSRLDRLVAPDLRFHAHSAPIGLTFYDGTTFPERYRGGAFIALRGSWNAADPRGYLVAFVPFTDEGRPDGEAYEVFASGFRTGGGTGGSAASVWGRPAGVAVTPDGALLIADDTGDTLWRVDYTGG
ncbi:PQQ-dependent sugar dehydrogenase [Tistrella bauzanensis]|uniref:PQQ-dependent sugar dehydrogenase n=1 Tax=Tistrella TaxID=171436 RepID=UPI0031F68748